MKGQKSYLLATWPAPSNVVAGISLRHGGNSNKPFDSNNMGAHVGDVQAAVQTNRLQLANAMDKSLTWQWLNQTHSVNVARVEQAGAPIDADAIYTNVPDIACCVMTADCLPIFITNKSGSEIAMVHAGWRGLADGILEQTLVQFSVSAEQLLVYLGPAIGPCHFEVGGDVKAAFAVNMAEPVLDKLFEPKGGDKYFADLHGLADAKLQAAGISNIFGGNDCTVCDQDRFFSFRRDGVTGRMVSFIYFSS